MTVPVLLALMAPTDSGPSGMIVLAVQMVALIAIFYFLLLRPQSQARKKHAELLANIKKGDEVVTAGGMLGKVSKLGETYVHVEISNGVEVQVQRSSVVQVLPKGTLK